MVIEGKGPLNTPVSLLCDADGRLYVEGQIALDSLPAGTNTIGKIGSDTFSTATLSSVSASASNQTLLAANANRKRVIIHNDSTATLYIKFGATASATSFSYCLFGGDTYESPALPIYTGIIDGIWSSATGAARITEGT